MRKAFAFMWIAGPRPRSSSLLFALAVSCGMACGPTANSTGSNTNWIELCDVDSDCGADQRCACNVCTTSCTSASECGGAECRAADDLGCDEPTVSGAGICVAPCRSDADCEAKAPGLVCRAGACLPEANPVAGTRTRSLSLSSEHACMVSRGSVYCWGSNTFGAVGHPAGETALVPRLIAGVTDAQSVAVSREHSCALTNAGNVYCWGGNDRGQVGVSSAPAMTCLGNALVSRQDHPCQPTPTRVQGITTAVQVAVSSGRSCALLGNGTMQCWGDVQSLGGWPLALTDVQSITLGAVGACAVTSRGELRCSDQAPGFVLPPAGLSSLAAAELSSDTTTNVDSFGCFLGVDGGVLCAGDASRGQLGIGARSAGSVDERALENTRDIALGAEHACALGNDAKVRCWGKNSEGQVGPAPLKSPPCESDTCEPSPLVVPGLPPIATIAAGGNLSCAVAQDGTLWCWGVIPMSLGAPLRVAGPWEASAEVCEGVIGNITTSVYQSAASDRSCVADTDCVGVSLNLSCNQTCAVAALSRASADATQKLLAELEVDACPQARGLGCSTPEVSCPASTSRISCVAGSCTQR